MTQHSLSHPSPRRRTPLSQRLLALLLWAGAGAAWAAPGWDIAGFKLGMSVDQARAALKAYNAQVQAKESQLKFSFHDGAKQQETESFVANMQVQIPGPPGSMDNERLVFEFSPPPQPQRVVRIRRELATWKNPASDERVLDSLTQKYGKPQTLAIFGIGVRNRVGHWAEPGKPVCGQQAGKPIHMTGIGQSPRDLQKIRQYQQQGRAPKDLSQCSAVLRADMTLHQGGSSVVGLVVEMQDYGAQLPALEATARWLEELEANARKARLNSGSAPKL